jgi:phenylacetate-CoA ligase
MSGKAGSGQPVLGSVSQAGLHDLVGAYAAAASLAEPCGALFGRDRLRLEDLPVTDSLVLAEVNRKRLAAGGGGYLVSSGGTTDRPKFAYVPHHQGAARIARTWRPLRSGEVMLNLFAPGRTWAAHYFYNRLAEECGAFTVPMGPMEPAEVAAWGPALARLGVSALAGTPTSITGYLRTARGRGPAMRKVIWVGEPVDSECLAELAGQREPAELWGNYGSIETWVIAANTPACPPDVLHLLPGQALELDQPRPLLTRAGHGWATSLMRYPLGDRIEAVTCPCGAPGSLRVLGRADDQMKFCGTLVSLGQVHAVLGELPDVAAAQLHLCCAADDRPLTAVERMRVLVRLRSGKPVSASTAGDAARIRAHLLTRVYDLGFIAGDEPDAVSVSVTDALPVSARTGKTQRFELCGPARPCAGRAAASASTARNEPA